MDKILAQMATWEYVDTLPGKIGNFVLGRLMCAEKTKYYIFAYTNSASRRKFTVLYDTATKDYFVHIKVGIHEYFDIEFITPDLKIFEQKLQQRMENTILSLQNFTKEALPIELVRTGILEWSFTESLPIDCAGFELFIRPSQPIKGINGSYIIIDYSDFLVDSNFAVYYNVFRNEFFAEIRFYNEPITTNCFDSKTLDDLANLLKTSMADGMAELREKIIQKV